MFTALTISMCINIIIIGKIANYICDTIARIVAMVSHAQYKSPKVHIDEKLHICDLNMSI